jgi:Restriction endonuclease
MPPRQRVSANAIRALKDALTDAFWFKKDLYSYAKAAVGGEPMFLAGIGWTDPDVYKRDSVSTFVDRLVRAQDEHQDLLLALLVDVASMTDFPQLARVEDHEAKIVAAREAVARLKEVVKPYEQALAERQAARDQITAAQAEHADRRATAQRLSELKDRYTEILQLEPHPRGLALEPFLRDLFDSFDLNPKASFRITGEQIDGGFTLDMEHFLVEAKWENAPTDRAALDIFTAKIDRKAENTLGLFVAISGFEPTAAEMHSGHRSPLILMDGADLYAVLDDRIDLRELLRRKRRHAAMTGNIFLTAAAVLSGT